MFLWQTTKPANYLSKGSLRVIFFFSCQTKAYIKKCQAQKQKNRNFKRRESRHLASSFHNNAILFLNYNIITNVPAVMSAAAIKVFPVFRR